MHIPEAIVSQLVLAAAGLLGVFLHSRLRKPSDLERAQLLTHLADELAASLKLANPTATWPDLVRLVVQALSAAAGVPTSNADAISQAATAAVQRLQLAHDGGGK